MDKNKIKKAKNKILNFFDEVDDSGENRKIYEEKFDNMTDKEFVEFVKNGPMKMYTKPFDIEPNLTDAKKALDFVGLPDAEKITLPFLYKDEELGDVLSQHKVAIIPIHLKRLQQMIYKENSSASDITQRDKTNQAMKDSKAAQLSNKEVAALAAKGFDKCLVELLSFRADHPESKQEAYDNIITENKTNIPDTIHDPDDKIALQYLHVLFLGMGISSNLVEELEDL